MTAGDLARRLFEAYADGDRDTIRAVLADDLTAYVTNADAGVDEVRGVGNTWSGSRTCTPPAGASRSLRSSQSTPSA